MDMTLQAYSHKFYSKFVDIRAFLGNLLNSKCIYNLEKVLFKLNQVTNATVYLTPIQQNEMTGNKLLYFQITIHKTDAKIYLVEEIRKDFKTIKTQ